MQGARSTDALPLQSLASFERLHAIEPGETRTWTLRIDAKTLAVTDGTGARVLLPGRHVIRIPVNDIEGLQVALLLQGSSNGIEISRASPALQAMSSRESR